MQSAAAGATVRIVPAATALALAPAPVLAPDVAETGAGDDDACVRASAGAARAPQTTPSRLCAGFSAEQEIEVTVRTSSSANAVPGTACATASARADAKASLSQLLWPCEMTGAQPDGVEAVAGKNNEAADAATLETAAQPHPQPPAETSAAAAADAS